MYLGRNSAWCLCISVLIRVGNTFNNSFAVRVVKNQSLSAEGLSYFAPIQLNDLIEMYSSNFNITDFNFNGSRKCYSNQ